MERIERHSLMTPSNPRLYADLLHQLTSTLQDETNFVTNAATTAALIFHTLPELNWAGFYILRGQQLVVGPYQGKPACIRIPMGRGVCGTAAERRESIVVDDVHQFPGHIACDSASNSEIVVPLVQDGQLLGVLDLDSPRPGRFDEEDRQGLERLVEEFLTLTDRPE